MMTKKEWRLKNVSSILRHGNSEPSRTLIQGSSSTIPTSSTPLISWKSLILCAIVVVSLLFCLLATGASATTVKSAESLALPTQKDSLWTSAVPTPSIVISIYVLPSLLDSLESAFPTSLCTSTSTQIRSKTESGLTNVPLNP